jgi:MFS family permease
MVDQATPAARGAASSGVSAGTRYYVLAILILVTTVGALDRQILSILVEPIRADLGMTDSAIGALGLVFALVYTATCFPVARLADTWSRVNVIAIGVTAWSLMTGACGLVASGAQLFAARIGVAIGEAGGAPPSHALIADMFPRHQRATAMSILMTCAPIGLAGGLFLGGWAAEEYSWRYAFFIAGALGVLLGPLVFFTFPRPRNDPSQPKASPPPFMATIKRLVAIKSLMFMLIGVGLMTLLAMSMNFWAPAFLARSHGMTTAEVGAQLGAALGVGALLGHLLGGPVFDFMGQRDLRWHMWLAAAIGPVSALLAILALTLPSIGSAVTILSIQAFVSGLFTGPMIAIIMNLAPVFARAMASALLTLMVNVLGMGAGPQIVGALSDWLRPHFGEESLRYALICATAIVIPATIFQIMASMHYRRDLAEAEAASDAGAH